MKKKVFSLISLMLLLTSCSLEEPEKVRMTFKFDCPVQEGIVSHINDKVHFSGNTISLEFLKGEMIDVYAEAFEEDSTMWIVRDTLEAVNDTVTLKLLPVGITITIDGEWKGLIHYLEDGTSIECTKDSTCVLCHGEDWIKLNQKNNSPNNL